jgi:hypothetical protein
MILSSCREPGFEEAWARHPNETPNCVILVSIETIARRRDSTLRKFDRTFQSANMRPSMLH